MQPRSWYDIPPELVMRDPLWRQTANIVVRELHHVLIIQSPCPVELTMIVHPAYILELAKRINKFQEN